MRKCHPFDAANPSHLEADSHPKMPQALEMVNQTVSIPSEPVTEKFVWRNILEYEQCSEDQLDEFRSALEQKDALRAA